PRVIVFGHQRTHGPIREEIQIEEIGVQQRGDSPVSQDAGGQPPVQTGPADPALQVRHLEIRKPGPALYLRPEYRGPAVQMPGRRVVPGRDVLNGDGPSAVRHVVARFEVDRFQTYATSPPQSRSPTDPAAYRQIQRGVAGCVHDVRVPAREPTHRLFDRVAVPGIHQ